VRLRKHPQFPKNAASASGIIKPTASCWCRAGIRTPRDYRFSEPDDGVDPAPVAGRSVLISHQFDVFTRDW
jgi:hypothetical protein